MWSFPLSSCYDDDEDAAVAGWATSYKPPSSSHVERLRRKRAQKRMMDAHSGSLAGMLASVVGEVADPESGSARGGKEATSTWAKARCSRRKLALGLAVRAKARSGVDSGGEKVGCWRGGEEKRRVCELLAEGVATRCMAWLTRDAPKAARRRC